MASSLDVEWTPRAALDLLDILEFVSRDNPKAAKKLANDIRKKADQLSTFPFLGREMSTGIRNLVPHRHYLLTYRVHAGRVEILQLRHVARTRSS
jgi:toxin ParE1/3/4